MFRGNSLFFAPLPFLIANDQSLKETFRVWKQLTLISLNTSCNECCVQRTLIITFQNLEWIVMKYLVAKRCFSQFEMANWCSTFHTGLNNIVHYSVFICMQINTMVLLDKIALKDIFCDYRICFLNQCWYTHKRFA